MGVTGVLGYAFGVYRIQPTEDAGYASRNPRPVEPPDVGGNLRGAVFNVLNYFEDFGSIGCGPQGLDDCRGANDQREFERQRAKIIAAITALDAHVVGLIEIENDADQGALLDLVEGLNDATAPGTYDLVDTGGPVGIDAIRVAIVYQPAFISPLGPPAVLDDMAFLDPNDTGVDRNRAALAQSFQRLLWHARPDLEEELSGVIGDVAAHGLGNLARGVSDWGRKAGSTLRQNLSEYLQEESRAVPSRYEVDKFRGDVEKVRDDVARLEARLALLEQNIETSRDSPR